MARLVKIALLTFACLLSGCAGLAVEFFGNDETTISNPMVGTDRGMFDHGYDLPELTAEDLRKFWGPPDWADRLETGGELWRYHFGLRWNGVGLLLLVVPIPILVPVGFEYVDFVIEKGVVTKAATKEHNAIASYGCLVSVLAIHGGNVFCSFGKERNRESRFFYSRRPPEGFNE